MANNEGICGAGIGGYMLYGNGVDDRLDGGGGNDTIKDEDGTDMCNGGHDINYMRSTCEAVTRAPKQALPVPPPGHSRTATKMKKVSQISPKSYHGGHQLWPAKLLLLCLLLPSSAIAADYYFAANGNDLNACTQAQPCRSIAKINTLINSAIPGDTFYLRGGQVFDGGNTRCIDAFDVDGTPGNPITIRSYGGGRAILQNCR
ncbi:MAG: hypothetical protein M3329_01755, partial [Pseudomonadota bacterium]|nr:hypothetical protein [Pseudomonadota bacterium]